MRVDFRGTLERVCKVYQNTMTATWESICSQCGKKSKIKSKQPGWSSNGKSLVIGDETRHIMFCYKCSATTMKNERAEIRITP